MNSMHTYHRILLVFSDINRSNAVEKAIDKDPQCNASHPRFDFAHLAMSCGSESSGISGDAEIISHRPPPSSLPASEPLDLSSQQSSVFGFRCVSCIVYRVSILTLDPIEKFIFTFILRQQPHAGSFGSLMPQILSNRRKGRALNRYKSNYQAYTLKIFIYFIFRLKPVALYPFILYLLHITNSFT